MPLSPPDIGLPEKFPEWRSGQFDAIRKILSAEKYGFLLDSPTGTGKSLIAAGVQKMKDTPATYLCSTKQLQTQLLKDFPYARELKGRGNYPCLLFEKQFPTITAEHCVSRENRVCKVRGHCPYMVAKQIALQAPLAILNYSYYLAEVNNVGGFSGDRYVIGDECDSIEDHLMNHVSLVITKRQMDRLGIPIPTKKTVFAAWVEWANLTIPIVERAVEQLEKANESEWDTPDLAALRREQEFKRLLSKLRFFSREVDKNWIWYPEAEKWTFKPVWVAKYAYGAFWKHMPGMLGMSATILDPWQISQNVGLKNYEYVALPSPFPKENRPVFYEPAANLTNKYMDIELPKLWGAVHRILEKHPNEKVLMHTVSYKVRNFLMDMLDDKKRLITHDTINRAEKLEEFKKSKLPLVLISPSMDRGVDLPYDQCRVVIICKVPYPDLADPQVKKRVFASNDGNNWYAHKTVSSLIQMAGRGTRAADDYSVTYILDWQFERIVDKNSKLFPKWFMEAVVR